VVLLQKSRYAFSCFLLLTRQFGVPVELAAEIY